LTCLAADSADVWLTVPAAWDEKGCSIMRSAAITAGLVHSSRAGDVNWRDRLHITPFAILCLISLRFLPNLLPFTGKLKLPLYTVHA